MRPGATRMQRTILVADESSTIRRIVELAFADTELRIETAASGREALDRLTAIPPDVLLVDVALGEPSGYDLCRMVKRSSRSVPVLLLTGAFDPFDREQAREAGADGHLVKPFDSSLLRARVAELLDAPVAAEPRSAPVPLAEPADPAVGPCETSVVDPALGVLAEDTSGLPPRAWVDAVAREVVARLSHDAVREIASEIVPRLAREMIRERIRELEQPVEDD